MWKPRSDEAKRQRIEAVYRRSKRLFPEVGELTVEELKERLGEQNLVVVDVRRPDEQAVSMIAGAITSDDFDSNPVAYEGATVVAYCTVGHRSGLYAQELANRGWNALNLKGAILAWTHVEGALEDENGPTRKVHIWSPPSLVAEGYEPVW
jgi:rhodanese-related sulfurtransferase